MINNIKSHLSLAHSGVIDLLRFVRSAHISSPSRNRLTGQAHILRLAHALEKGMALPRPKPGFGLEKADDLIDFIRSHISSHGADSATEIGIATLSAFLLTPRKNAGSLKPLQDKFRDLAEHHTNPRFLAGNRIMTKSEVIKSLPQNPDHFFFNRVSLRQFNHEPIPEHVLIHMVKLAQRAPSVCNRQSGRAHLFTRADDISEVLALQDGNRGFGEDASALAIITADVSCFYKPGERNQAWIDGGLFAMSMVYAAHTLGLGSCMLNWSQTARRDSAMRKLAQIPENEAIVTLIAFGQIPDEFSVATSPRIPVEGVLRLNSSLRSTVTR